MNNIKEMIETVIDDVNVYRNRCAEKFFNTIHANGIEDDDAVFDLFNDLMDGFDDVDEAVNVLMELNQECGHGIIKY